MFSSIYAGLSGLISFSKGLDVISNNVANLNTPGFKSSQLFFEDLFYQQRQTGSNNGSLSTVQFGSGVDTSQTRLKFAQGELRETRNTLDVAIDGNGFFVLRDNNRVYYTRNGQFEFDADGYLVEKGSNARLASLIGGILADININGHRANAPQPTTEISFTGNLSSGSQEKEISNVTVFDSNGGSRVVTIKFTNNSSTKAGNWTIKILDSNNQELSSGEIEFNGNGSPKTDLNTHKFRLDANNPESPEITLNFGDPDSLTGTTSFSGGTSSDVRVGTQNGRSAGFVTKVSINEDGHVEVAYSNAQTEKFERIALAWFDNLQDLEQVGGNLFVSKENQTPRLSFSGQDAMGKLAPGRVELSNVELTEQFTDLIIVQRGYQASSQVITVGNEMMQQLFDLKARR
jgi:flagellar hook protein FlgE